MHMNSKSSISTITTTSVIRGIQNPAWPEGTGNRRCKGLKVLDVDDESAAEKAGIKEGDVITSFDGSEVNNIDKLRELSKAAIDKGNFKVKLTRDGKEQELDVKIPKNLKSTNL